MFPSKGIFHNKTPNNNNNLKEKTTKNPLTYK